MKLYDGGVTILAILLGATGLGWTWNNLALKSTVKKQASSIELSNTTLQKLNTEAQATAASLKAERERTRDLELKYTSEFGQFKQGVSYDISRSWKQAADIKAETGTAMTVQHESDLKRYTDAYGFNAVAAANAWSEAALKSREQQIASLDGRVKQLEQQLSEAAARSQILEKQLRESQVESGNVIGEQKGQIGKLKDAVDEKASMITQLKDTVFWIACVAGLVGAGYLVFMWLMLRIKTRLAMAAEQAAKLKQATRQFLLNAPEGNDQMVNALHAVGMLGQVITKDHDHLVDKIKLPDGRSLGEVIYNRAAGKPS